jgi:hypothetical protein
MRRLPDPPALARFGTLLATGLADVTADPAALEPVPRGPYCGAVGWVDADRGKISSTDPAPSTMAVTSPPGRSRIQASALACVELIQADQDEAVAAFGA